MRCCHTKRLNDARLLSTASKRVEDPPLVSFSVTEAKVTPHLHLSQVNNQLGNEFQHLAPLSASSCLSQLSRVLSQILFHIDRRADADFHVLYS